MVSEQPSAIAEVYDLLARIAERRAGVPEGLQESRRVVMHCVVKITKYYDT